jgi:hypothetical protein
VIVRRLFQALAFARTMPTTFTIDAMNPNGITSFCVLVLDDVVFTEKVLPALNAAGISVAALLGDGT